MPGVAPAWPCPESPTWARRCSISRSLHASVSYPGSRNGRLAIGTERVVFVLVVGGFVAHPVVKAAAAPGRNVVIAVVGAVQVPLADVGGVVAGTGEGVGHRGQLGVQPAPVRHHPALVRVAPGQQRAAKRRTPGRPRHSAVEAHPLARQVVDVGCEHVAVAAVAGGVGAVLVAEDPHHVGPPAGRKVSRSLTPAILPHAQSHPNPHGGTRRLAAEAARMGCMGQRFSVNESGMDARRVISERANQGISCNSFHYKELQD